MEGVGGAAVGMTSSSELGASCGACEAGWDAGCGGCSSAAPTPGGAALNSSTTNRKPILIDIDSPTTAAPWTARK